MQMGLGKKDRRADRLGLRGEPLRRMVQQRIEQLRRYRWSSYRAYLGLEKRPAWLECGAVLELDGKGARPEQQKSYQRYVEEAVREGLQESPWEQLKGQFYLGSQQTWEKLCQTVKAGTREQPQGRTLGRRPSFAEIVSVVEELKGEKWEEICDRRSDWGRELALYLGRRLSVMKLRDLGQQVGGSDYAAVSIAIKRFEGRLSAEPKRAQIVQKARARLMDITPIQANVECLDPVGEMAGFGGPAGLWFETGPTSDPVGTSAGFGPWTDSDPAGGMAGFGSSTWRSNRR
jgi:hypothetical protein